MKIGQELDDFIKNSIDHTLGLNLPKQALQLKLESLEMINLRLRDQYLCVQSKLQEKESALQLARSEANMNAQSIKKFVEENGKLASECKYLASQSDKWEQECSLYDHDREALMEFGNEADERAAEAECRVIELQEELTSVADQLDYYKLQYESLSLDRKRGPTELMAEAMKKLNAGADDSVIDTLVARRKRKAPASTSTSAAVAPSPARAPSPPIRKDKEVAPVAVDLTGEVPSPTEKDRESLAAAAEAQARKEKSPTAPPPKKARTEPRPASAAVTQEGMEKQPAPTGGKGVAVISSSKEASKGDQALLSTKGAEIDYAKLKGVGMTLASRFQEWVELAVTRLQEQEDCLGQKARELAAAKEEVEKAKQSAAAERRCRLAADQRTKAATDKAVALTHEVATLKEGMAKLEAEKALVEKERDKQAAGHKNMGEAMLTWKSSYEVLAKRERQTKAELVETQAVLAQREGDIQRLRTVTIPNMCAMYRDQIEEAIREAIKRVAAEGFPWDAFETVLDDLVAKQEEKLLAEAAEKARA